jgi:hypothetical protein
MGHAPGASFAFDASVGLIYDSAAGLLDTGRPPRFNFLTGAGFSFDF